jgi:hypothetical protein
MLAKIRTRKPAPPGEPTVRLDEQPRFEASLFLLATHQAVGLDTACCACCVCRAVLKVTMNDGSVVPLWCTFSDQQVC